MWLGIVLIILGIPFFFGHQYLLYTYPIAAIKAAIETGILIANLYKEYSWEQILWPSFIVGLALASVPYFIKDIQIVQLIIAYTTGFGVTALGLVIYQKDGKSALLCILTGFIWCLFTIFYEDSPHLLISGTANITGFFVTLGIYHGYNDIWPAFRCDKVGRFATFYLIYASVVAITVCFQIFAIHLDKINKEDDDNEEID